MSVPLTNVIPVQGERQAMDWSLVLASQGIEAFIEREPESPRWLLVIRGSDFPRAVQTLRAYLTENKTRRWTRELPGAGLLFDARGAAALWIFGLLFMLQTSGPPGFTEAGVMSNQAVQGGQWWRLFTAVSLHGDIAHLAANLSSGFILIGLAMGAYGRGLGWMLAYLAGVAGNFAGFIFYPATHQVLGASGMVLGALGLLTAQSITLFRHGISSRQLAVRSACGGLLLLVLLGLSPAQNVDVLAHVGGFGAGAMFGVLFGLLPGQVIHQPAIQWSAGVSAGLLFAGTWWLALR